MVESIDINQSKTFYCTYTYLNAAQYYIIKNFRQRKLKCIVRLGNQGAEALTPSFWSSLALPAKAQGSAPFIVGTSWSGRFPRPPRIPQQSLPLSTLSTMSFLKASRLNSCASSARERTWTMSASAAFSSSHKYVVYDKYFFLNK